MNEFEHQCIIIQNGGATCLTNVIRNEEVIPWRSKFISQTSLAEKTIIWGFVRAVVNT